ELDAVLAEAESLLIHAVSEAAQHSGPGRWRRRLRFWKAARDITFREVSGSGSTNVVPFPGTMRSGASSPRCLDGSTAARPVPIGWSLRLFLLVVLAVLPMVAIQVWHEHDLRNERAQVIRERVVYRVQQLSAEIGELREGARQLLLAIAQLDAIKLRQP